VLGARVGVHTTSEIPDSARPAFAPAVLMAEIFASPGLQEAAELTRVPPVFRNGRNVPDVDRSSETPDGVKTQSERFDKARAQRSNTSSCQIYNPFVLRVSKHERRFHTVWHIGEIERFSQRLK
jgi:hypothetical protein